MLSGRASASISDTRCAPSRHHGLRLTSRRCPAAWEITQRGTGRCPGFRRHRRARRDEPEPSDRSPGQRTGRSRGQTWGMIGVCPGCCARSGEHDTPIGSCSVPDGGVPARARSVASWCRCCESSRHKCAWSSRCTSIGTAPWLHRVYMAAFAPLAHRLITPDRTQLKGDGPAWGAGSCDRDPSRIKPRARCHLCPPRRTGTGRRDLGLSQTGQGDRPAHRRLRQCRARAPPRDSSSQGILVPTPGIRGGGSGTASPSRRRPVPWPDLIHRGSYPEGGLSQTLALFDVVCAALRRQGLEAQPGHIPWRPAPTGSLNRDNDPSANHGSTASRTRRSCARVTALHLCRAGSSRLVPVHGLRPRSTVGAGGRIARRAPLRCTAGTHRAAHRGGIGGPRKSGTQRSGG